MGLLRCNTAPLILGAGQAAKAAGMPTAEGSALKRFYSTDEKARRFAKYFRSTPPIVPFVPAWYAAMPLPLKRALCCEFPMYEYRSEGVGRRESEISLGESPPGSASGAGLLENGYNNPAAATQAPGQDGGATCRE